MAETYHLRATIRQTTADRLSKYAEAENRRESNMADTLLTEAMDARDRRSDAFERPSARRKPVSKGEH